LFFEKEYSINTIINNDIEKTKVYWDESSKQIFLMCRNETYIKVLLKSKIVEKSKKKLIEITKEKAKYYKLQPKKIYVKDQKSRWGSCSSKGNINLNWRLSLCPLFITEYVTIHELVHLIHFNHSKNFWEKVHELMKNYQIAKNWLRRNQKDIFLILT